jgi:hypothetical protein
MSEVDWQALRKASAKLTWHREISHRQQSSLDEPEEFSVKVAEPSQLQQRLSLNIKLVREEVSFGWTPVYALAPWTWVPADTRRSRFGTEQFVWAA